MSTQLKLFDYGTLSEETSAVVQQRTGEIRGLMRRAAQDIVDIGLKLIEVKERLGHGRFLPWLQAEFEWSYPSAARFMQVAERFGSKSSQIDNFAPSALYLLAAPSTPEPARQEALGRAAAGEEITHQVAKQIVNEHRAPAAPAQQGSTMAPAADYADAMLGPALDDPDSFDDPDEEEEVDAATYRPSPILAMPEPIPALPKPPPRYPHSDRLAHWLRAVSSQTLVIEVDFGGIKGLVTESDKWDWRYVKDFILPMLEAHARTVETFRKEIADHVPNL